MTFFLLISNIFLYCVTIWKTTQKLKTSDRKIILKQKLVLKQKLKIKNTFLGFKTDE